MGNTLDYIVIDLYLFGLMHYLPLITKYFYSIISIVGTMSANTLSSLYQTPIPRTPTQGNDAKQYFEFELIDRENVVEKKSTRVEVAEEEAYRPINLRDLAHFSGGRVAHGRVFRSASPAMEGNGVVFLINGLEIKVIEVGRKQGWSRNGASFTDVGPE